MYAVILALFLAPPSTIEIGTSCPDCIIHIDGELTNKLTTTKTSVIVEIAVPVDGGYEYHEFVYTLTPGMAVRDFYTIRRTVWC